ncbi:MAG: adenylate/guanylate cyclase domain-containing protein [Candidatus Hydrogenedentes bacterium]|nr:adenylate/guanylate cyclase domain-containing protein [Candidatus Hydrogenedentota bacterium]
MDQLIVEQQGLAPITVPMFQPVVHLGRADDNNVVLVVDEVSRHHAKVLRRGDQVVLMDLNSTNGSYVNRQRIVERVLAHMDEIWLGSKCRIVFRTDGPELQRPDPARESAVVQDLQRIRQEMETLERSMTMIGRSGATPAPRAGQKPPGSSEADLLRMSKAFRRLSALYQASKLIASDFDLNKRLAAVLDTAIDVLGAQRGFIMLRDEATSSLKVSVAREMAQDLQASSPSMGIAGRSAIDGEPVLMADRDSDAQFGGRESIIRQQIRSAMCVPLQVEDRILGSIYVDTRSTEVAFTQEDLELFLSLAAQSAMAIDNVRLYERMVEAEKKRASLGRFLSPSIVEEIMKQDTELELGGNKLTVTTMFCDVRGFTPIAERISPHDLVDMLNEHFTAMTAIIFGLEGTLDKYIGDEIMAVFGSPVTKGEDALRCVKAALLMIATNHELNVKRTAEGRPAFELGIGIATGEAVAGFIGSPDRMEFTVIGDRVNTARRLCSIAEPGQLIICDTTHAEVREFVKAKPIGTVMLKGKEEPVHAYEVESLV